jgi:hypothetical protein
MGPHDPRDPMTHNLTLPMVAQTTARVYGPPGVPWVTGSHGVHGPPPHHTPSHPTLGAAMVWQVTLEIADALADGSMDGATDTYTILVSVSAGSPMPSPYITHADGTASCDERPTAANVSSAAPIKCVEDASFGSDATTCSNPSSLGICPPETRNQWPSLQRSSGRVAFSDDEQSCVTLAPASPPAAPGAAAQFCTCKQQYRQLFARAQMLSDAPFAVCPSVTCAASDQSCAIRHNLQQTYEQLCGLQRTACNPGYVVTYASGTHPTGPHPSPPHGTPP